MKQFFLFSVILLIGCTRPLSEVEKAERRLDQLEDSIRPLHSYKKAAEPGDWLWEHQEAGQTFSEFRADNASRSYERSTIYVQPIGPFTPEETKIISDTTEGMKIFFGRQVKQLEPISFDALSAKSWRRHPATDATQLLTTSVLNLLVPNLPKDALAMIAFTSVDLWPGDGWNFVFGQASFEKPVGVWSLHRMGNPQTEYQKCLQRTLKIAFHETGHMLGIKHCTAFECGMNGTNSLEETDAHPTAFCAVCERKLWWALELDVVGRYKELTTFATSRGLTEEARFWDKSHQKANLAID